MFDVSSVTDTGGVSYLMLGWTTSHNAMANSQLLWISREHMATLSPTSTAYVTIHYINAFGVNSHFT